MKTDETCPVCGKGRRLTGYGESKGPYADHLVCVRQLKEERDQAWDDRLEALRAQGRAEIELGKRTDELDGVEVLLRKAAADLKRAEAEVERLRCCGNCDEYGDWGEDSHCAVDNRKAYQTTAYHPPLLCDPGDSCHFTPSRWQRREEAHRD